jgi:hypothetical protein
MIKPGAHCKQADGSELLHSTQFGVHATHVVDVVVIKVCVVIVLFDPLDELLLPVLLPMLMLLLVLMAVNVEYDVG